ncbi:LacI family transcriptional regulator [Marinoscillum furvescens DSM 4134]|uniref:LacI family transcriptional regulator n=2 Tax=Marinoscillum furvescens TaxID=1026 RepID=A0A3D9L5V3_MARFU|nr:LacI family transcriptional regulator [Marinoscillum furvescens DSM 4134]
MQVAANSTANPIGKYSFMKKKKTSLKDIAKEVGVSIATVSYVLSKGANSRVSVEMSEKIKKVAKELNYQPNQIAKSLKSGKTHTIGLIVADISNPFFAHIARIVEDEAAKLDYTVIFGSSDEKADKSWGLIKFLMNRQVDGFIIVPSEGSNDQIQYLEDHNKPYVLIDRRLPERESNYVVIDNHEVAYQAVKRLIDTGNERIGMIAYSNGLQHMRDRVSGYRMALQNHGISFDNSWLKAVNFDQVKEGVRAGIDDLLNGPKPIDAIFFATNTLAVEGLKYLDKLNVRVPDDISIVCFDQGDAFDFYYCPLTYVKQPLVTMSEEAVRILISQIDDPSLPKVQKSLQAELVIGKSCSGRLMADKN